MEQNGVVSNPLEILRKAIPSFAGRSNAGTSNANNDNQRTAGGSQLQLRNLPTLILVNGRRVANSGVGGINGKNFVDVNQIPAAAIDHIEVLTDGASSIYGSDAIGGVVNFILKSDYKGFNFGGRYGFANGDYKERSAYATGGTELGPVSFTATGSYSKTSPLFQSARAFTSPLYGKTSSIPGVVAVGSNNPGCHPGAGHQHAERHESGRHGRDRELGQSTDRQWNVRCRPHPPRLPTASMSPNFRLCCCSRSWSRSSAAPKSKLFDGRAEVFSDVMISQSRSFTQWLPVPASGLTVPAGAPYNPLTTNFGGVTFDDLDAPKQFFNNVKSLRLTAGCPRRHRPRLDLGDGLSFSARATWCKDRPICPTSPISRWPSPAATMPTAMRLLGGAYSKVHSGYSLTGPLVLQPALDPFARGAAVNPAALANVYGTEFINARSALMSVDLQVVGTLFELPAGKVSLAVGGSFRRESLSGRADPNGRVTDPVTGSRDRATTSSGSAEPTPIRSIAIGISRPCLRRRGSRSPARPGTARRPRV